MIGDGGEEEAYSPSIMNGIVSSKFHLDHFNPLELMIASTKDFRHALHVIFLDVGLTVNWSSTMDTRGYGMGHEEVEFNDFEIRFGFNLG